MVHEMEVAALQLIQRLGVLPYLRLSHQGWESEVNYWQCARFYLSLRRISNWKDGSIWITNHEKTATHETAVEVMITLPRTTGNVGEMLSSTLATEKCNNRPSLLKFAESIKFLARQGPPLWGNGDEADSNFMQLLYLHVADDPQMLSCMLQQRRKVYQSSNVYQLVLKTITHFIPVWQLSDSASIVVWIMYMQSCNYCNHVFAFCSCFYVIM